MLTIIDILNTEIFLSFFVDVDETCKREACMNANKAEGERNAAMRYTGETDEAFGALAEPSAFPDFDFSLNMNYLYTVFIAKEYFNTHNQAGL